jgi:hypothetical protein
MNIDGVSGGRITQGLIPGRSLRVRWLRNRRTVYSTLCPDVKAPVLTAVTSGLTHGPRASEKSV